MHGWLRAGARSLWQERLFRTSLIAVGCFVMQQVCVCVVWFCAGVYVCACICVCCACVCKHKCVLEVELKREKRSERCTSFRCCGGTEEMCLSPPSPLPPPQDYALAISELHQCTRMRPALQAPLLKYLGRLNLAVSHTQTDCLCGISAGNCCVVIF